MDTKQKIRAGVLGGLAGLGVIVGGASLASGASSTTTPAAPAQSSAPYGDVADAPGGQQPDRDHDGRPCHGKGADQGSTQDATPSAPTTTTPQT